MDNPEKAFQTGEDLKDKTEPNLANAYISSVLQRCVLPHNIDLNKPITLRDNLEKSSSFQDLVAFTTEIPQEFDGTVRYGIIEGWSRETILQAEEIVPLDPNFPIFLW